MKEIQYLFISKKVNDYIFRQVHFILMTTVYSIKIVHSVKIVYTKKTLKTKRHPVVILQQRIYQRN